MPALRTLLRPWKALFMPRPYCLNACRHTLHADVQPGESSVMQSTSADGTYRQHVDDPGHTSVIGFASENAHSALDSKVTEATSLEGPLMHSTQVLHKLSSAASRTLKPRASSRQIARSQGAVQHIGSADDSAFAPASDSKDKHFEALPCQAQEMIARCKGHKCLQPATASGLLHRKVSFLESEQVSLRDAAVLRRSRAFKSASFEHLAAVLKVLKAQLRSGEKACQALAMNPGVLSHPLEELEQKLKVMADFEITEAAVRKVCASKGILPVKVESICKTLSFWKDIGLNVEARNKILWKHPRMLLQSSEGSILHTMNFFESLGMTREKILHLYKVHPSIMLLSVDNLREKCMFFQDQLGFSVKNITRVISCGVPQLSMETLQAKVKFFKDEGFSDRDVFLLVSRQPGTILLGSEAVKRKLDFLLCKQKYDMADIVKWPICLLCSFENRMIPRFKALEENGLSKPSGLPTILGYSNLKFLKFMERKVQ